MKPVNKTDRGRKGEEIARRYLKEKGYILEHANWRYKHKEIDLIAREGGHLVFIEVKLRSTDYFMDPADAVSLKKQRYLIEAAEAYIDTLDEEPDVRFDIVAIVDTTPNMEITLIQDAFTPV